MFQSVYINLGQESENFYQKYDKFSSYVHKHLLSFDW